jgi:RNA polymerase sigma-70 factor (ECF subfamily)
VADKDILDAIRKDPAAFKQLFHLYYKPIFGYIFRRVGDFEDTADIASESFVKASRQISKFEYRGISIKAWLYRIATNEVNLHFRHQRKRAKLFVNYPFDDIQAFKKYIAEDKKVMENELVRHEQFVFMMDKLKGLPVKYQEVISLRYFEGKEIKEIAEILGLKEGTLKSLLSRGLDKLRNICN